MRWSVGLDELLLSVPRGVQREVDEQRGHDDQKQSGNIFHT